MQKLRAATGPDEWTQGLFALEAIARAAREAGDWDLAERAARQMLERDPAYAGTQYAWALVTDAPLIEGLIDVTVHLSPIAPSRGGAPSS